jgi:hypothetical protein
LWWIAERKAFDTAGNMLDINKQITKDPRKQAVVWAKREPYKDVGSFTAAGTVK